MSEPSAVADPDTPPPSDETVTTRVTPYGAVVHAGSRMRRFLSVWDNVTMPGLVGRIFGASPLPRGSGALYRDAVSEFTVAQIVGGLGAEWQVVHGPTLGGDAGNGVDTPRDEVSHIVVGDRGVFAVTTVNPGGGPVWVSANSFVHDGARMAHLRDAEYNALRLSQRLFEHCGLRVEVVPGVVVANPRRLIVDRHPRRVALLRPSQLTSWVSSHPPIFTAEESRAIARAAGALVRADDSLPLSEVLARFGEAHTRVVHAGSRRIGWLALVLLALWVALVAATAEF